MTPALNALGYQRHIYLASSSPRRAEILKSMGISFQILVPNIDETFADATPQQYVLRLASSKARVVLGQLKDHNLPSLPVLGADTTVTLDGDILGKPEDEEDGYESAAYRMLSRMSGGWHEVYTAVALALPSGIQTAVSVTRVRMAPLSAPTIHAYIASGEPRGKAGAYGIQGMGSVLIERIEGSYSGVMGLPVFETAALLNAITD